MGGFEGSCSEVQVMRLTRMLWGNNNTMFVGDGSMALLCFGQHLGAWSLAGPCGVLLALLAANHFECVNGKLSTRVLFWVY